MKFLLPPALPAGLLLLFSFISGEEDHLSPMNSSPLGLYSPAWNDARYLTCNTAANTGYMSAGEKEVFYILNMARMNPALFANTVVKQYPNKSNKNYLQNSGYYKSLLNELLTLKPMKSFSPDSLCYESAFCHALSTGKEGYVGHDRLNEICRNNTYFNGECCDYGHNKALDILLSLLIDENVSSLGHRKICLDSYKKLGVSIQPHLNYGYTAVLDFKY